MSSRSCLILVSLSVASRAGAQMPGTPVLQNAWAASGIVVALDIGGGSGGSTAAGAAAWAPSSGRFQLSAGGGMQRASGSASRGVYGTRLALPLKQMMGGNVGIAAFAGIGGGAGTAKDTVRATSMVPAGLAIGYRRAVGAGGKGFSIYGDPSYQLYSGPKNKKGYIRFGVGMDAGITSRFGVTLGLESGAVAAAGTVGPRGILYGLGGSMKLGR